MDVHYLDNHTTTQPAPEVVEAMLPFLGERFGHPGSRAHAYGWAAERAMDTAREQVAELIGAHPAEVIFTSGATESDNLAIKGAALARVSHGKHIITSEVESRPVLDCCLWLKSQGYEVDVVPCDADGRVDAVGVAGRLRDDTILVSIQLANQEVGTLQPIHEIAKACDERGAWLHVDARVGPLWTAIDTKTLPAHLITLCAHRMHGPKGIGALYIRRRRPRVRLAPLIHGGSNERGLRGGTPNVPGAVGFGVAATLCDAHRDDDAKRVAGLRDKLEQKMIERVERAVAIGPTSERIPSVSNISFGDVEGEAVLVAARNIALATGSACTSSDMRPSYVLGSMGLLRAAITSTIRFALGRYSTVDDVDQALADVPGIVKKLRAMAP